jgi:4'-phosphopantetheinyl transferase
LPVNELLLWPVCQDVPPLEAAAVHVWSASLVASDDALRRLHEWLSPDERERAARFRVGYLRDRFVISRGRQREILAAYLSARPDELRFEYGEVGKPRLADLSPGETIHFNLSNSNEIALLAVSRDRELGIDVEHLDRRTNGDTIAKRFFSEREKQVLAETPADDRRRAFFRCWTRKEAVLKALGVGLTFPLDRVEVSIAENETPSLLALDSRLGKPDAWTLFDLQPADRYVAALAVPRGPGRIREYAWRGVSQGGAPDG